MNTFKLQKQEAKHVRILLYGPVAAGKSSFISSVKTILTGKMSGICLANAAENSQTSFTKKVRKSPLSPLTSYYNSFSKNVSKLQNMLNMIKSLSYFILSIKCFISTLSLSCGGRILIREVQFSLTLATLTAHHHSQSS